LCRFDLTDVRPHLIEIHLHTVQESEWLRVALKQWLDDEYCPEPANEDISSRCGKVYYRCLLEGVDDIGDILIEFVSRENQKASFACLPRFIVL
jgi:hypothetical protein